VFSDLFALARRRGGLPALALAACALWLLLQNSLLLLWFTGPKLAPAFVVMRAIVRVGLHLLADWWMLPAAVVLGVALALSDGGRPRVRVRGVSHVG